MTSELQKVDIYGPCEASYDDIPFHILHFPRFRNSGLNVSGLRHCVSQSELAIAGSYNAFLTHLWPVGLPNRTDVWEEREQQVDACSDKLYERGQLPGEPE